MIPSAGVDRRPLDSLPLLFFVLAAIFLIRPFGEFPLNDDWQYAAVAKRFSETGRLLVDTPVAPALVGQVLLVAPFLKLLGFSHAVLRGVTMIMLAVIATILRQLLTLADVAPLWRAGALAVALFNPLTVYLATTFMTEIYGYAFGLAAFWIWFSVRKDPKPVEKGDVLPEVALFPVLAAALLSGAAFWTRQFCALAYPALAGAYLATSVLNGRWLAARRCLPALLGGLALQTALVAGYFVWARASGNYKAEFSGPLSQLFTLRPETLIKELLIYIFYVTAFSLPLLLVGARNSPRLWWALGVMAVLELLLISAGMRWPLEYHVDAFVHREFPFLGNIIYNAGVGPITLTDVYDQHAPAWPHWPPIVWRIPETAIMLGLPFWGRPWRAARAPGPAASGFRQELLWAFGLYAVGILLVSIQVYVNYVYDRYHFLSALVAPVMLALVLEDRLPLSRARVAAFMAAWLPIAWFSVAGVHDEFRIQEARWDLVAAAQARGVDPATLDGGYEVNGWAAFVGLGGQGPKTVPRACRGPCQCSPSGRMCEDDSYRIGMNLPAGYETLGSLLPAYWLTFGPPLRLFRRRIPETPLGSGR